MPGLLDPLDHDLRLDNATGRLEDHVRCDEDEVNWTLSRDDALPNADDDAGVRIMAVILSEGWRPARYRTARNWMRSRMLLNTMPCGNRDAG